MMDELAQIIKDFSGLGIGGTIAGITLWYARRDYLEHAKEKFEISKAYSERLEHHINNNKQERQAMMELMQETSQTITANTEVIRSVKEEIVRHFK